MPGIVFRISNAVIRKSALPNFSFGVNLSPKSVRETTFDELQGSLQSYISRRQD
jgi:hypothetical protein